MSLRNILVNATVDRVGDGKWEVKVWGKPPHEFTRVYTLEGKTDNFVAQEAMRLFCEEVESYGKGPPKG